MPTFDLRSDTVTQPTEAMRAAMARAPVGDDCYGDDPTVRALEQTVAERLGKPAAVYLPSGTMANQIAVRVRCRPGDAIATHPRAHVRIHENASAASLSGAQIMSIGDRHGYSVEQLAALCHEESCGWPPVRLCWLENTLGDIGGALWPHDEPERGMAQIAAWARAHGRAIHLDGARLWNAHIASGVPLPTLAACGDSVSVALSKGLGAPMGSVLCGDEAFIERARLHKHALGGGLRQAGIVAAAGVYALEHHVERLAMDHARARALAEGVRDLWCWTVREPQTNLVVAEVGEPFSSAEEVCRALRGAGVLCYPNTYREVRWVVHLGIDDRAVGEIIEIVRRVVGELVESVGRG